jgi:ParB-like chromosome segregation protein Spo0J
MHFRDRIKAFHRVAPDKLVPHPGNPRRHPEVQRRAVAGVLESVGFAGAALVRELPDGRYQLIDGHLRTELVRTADSTGDPRIPVLVLDVDEREASQLLLTHDALGGLAESDPRRLARLLDDASPTDERLTPLWEKLQGQLGRPTLPRARSPASQLSIPRLFQVVVECDGESQQRAVYERLQSEGLPCRVLTLL